MTPAETLAREQQRAIRESLELAMLQQIKLLRLDGEMTREHQFCTRKWKFDFAFPKQRIALECEGGAFTGGAHTRGAHFTSDCEKYNTALVLGWRVLRVTGDQIKRGQAAEWLRQAMAV